MWGQMTCPGIEPMLLKAAFPQHRRLPPSYPRGYWTCSCTVHWNGYPRIGEVSSVLPGGWPRGFLQEGALRRLAAVLGFLPEVCLTEHPYHTEERNLVHGFPGGRGLGWIKCGELPGSLATLPAHGRPNLHSSFFSYPFPEAPLEGHQEGLVTAGATPYAFTYYWDADAQDQNSTCPELTLILADHGVGSLLHRFLWVPSLQRAPCSGRNHVRF